jgi:hypothetical protein
MQWVTFSGLCVTKGDLLGAADGPGVPDSERGQALVLLIPLTQ